MNKYSVPINVQEKRSSIGLAIAAVEFNRVIELQFVEDILGNEYHVITHGLAEITEETLDTLFLHEKIKQACYEMACDGDVCFGVLTGDTFIEL